MEHSLLPNRHRLHDHRLTRSYPLSAKEIQQQHLRTAPAPRSHFLPTIQPASQPNLLSKEIVRFQIYPDRPGILVAITPHAPFDSTQYQVVLPTKPNILLPFLRSWTRDFQTQLSQPELNQRQKELNQKVQDCINSKSTSLNLDNIVLESLDLSSILAIKNLRSLSLNNCTL